MDNSPASPQPLGSNLPQTNPPTVIPPQQTAQLSQPAMGMPQPNAIYPAATVGVTAPLVSPTAAVPAAPNVQFGNSYSPVVSTAGSHSFLALCLGGASAFIIPLLIFSPSFADSLTKATIWLVLATLLSLAGLGLGYLSQKASETVDLKALMAIIVSTVMAVFCLIIGSYYIKLQMTINSYKHASSQYNGL